MPALTPSFVYDLETNMRIITENEYARLAQNLWWTEITKVVSSESKKELFMWLLSTATIKSLGKGGNLPFEDILSSYTSIENLNAGDGLRLNRNTVEDLDGKGIDIAAKWSADIGAQTAYWPQKQVANLLKNGATASLVTTYDGKALFAQDHSVNPFDSIAGVYSNLFTGAPSGSYPGALPIDASVTIDTAFNNLALAYGYISGLKMPNGEDPRKLRIAKIIVPPALALRALQLTQSKFIAQAAAGGGAAMADVSGLLGTLGFAKVIVADELAGFENDKTYFIVTEELASSELGAIIYSDREPFTITYYTGRDGGDGVDAILDRSDELEWHCKGRNVAGPGHPYGIFKVKGV